MKDICKSFSGVYANDHINLSIEEGEIHALLGENGAGKTTLVNILYGLYEADSGEIFWNGEKASFRSPADAIRAGIGMVQQHFSLVRNMTVLDNVILNLPGNAAFLKRKEAGEKFARLAAAHGLLVDPGAVVADLTVGEQQRVEILKALYRNVKLLILDEPTAVLTPQETVNLFQVLRSLAGEGYAIIIITHRLSEIMEVTDRVSILRSGRKVAELDTASTDVHELSRHMIGHDIDEMPPPDIPPREAPMLRLDSVSLERKRLAQPLHDIRFSIRKGEILGVAGVEGNGQKELAEVICGIRRHTSGTIFLEDADISHLGVRPRYEAGIAYISDDRQGDGLVPDMNITENLALRAYGKPPMARHGLVDARAMSKVAAEKTQEYQVLASGRSGAATPVRLLSGGNQQKLIIARELEEGGKLIVACQPTRGLDIGASEFVHQKLRAWRDAGKSVLLISADLEEIRMLSDRVAVLFGGRVVGVLTREEASVQALGLLMGGVTAAAAEGAGA
jgi:simple sugar transport system ATP-binding protein